MSLKWKNEVVYQIFPDRWCNGDPSNDVRRGEYKWHGHPVQKTTNRALLTSPRLHQHYFYGGDLAGITKRVSYLADLGVTAVYLTPIFKSGSSHKYDTDDYLTLDPHFGTRADFETMVRSLRAAGIKTILDGVFNHTSFQHHWYSHLDTRRKFYCMKNSDKTMTWMNGSSLPKLNPDHPRVEREILRVIDAWPEVDGWRLDAAHLLPVKFLRKLKRKVESIRRTNLVIMEDWTDSSGHFQDKICDGVTNFLFRDAVERFLVEDCSPETFLKRLQTWISRYPWPNVLQSWNLLDNHDTFRMYSRLGRNLSRYKIAQMFQFTIPGTPMIYQGDEIGMTGHHDADSRAPMVWDRRSWNLDILNHTRRWTRLRALHPVLSTGRWRPLLAVNASRVLAFERRGPGRDRAIVAVNDGYQTFDLNLPPLRLKLPPHSYAIRISDRLVRNELIRSWDSVRDTGSS